MAYDTRPDMLFGYPPYFKAIVNHTKKSGPQLIFNKDYSFDEYGARYTPKIDQQVQDVVFLGGSNTFGEGVNDEAVFTYRLQKKFKDIKFYNFAYRGWGLDQSWVLIKNNRFINSKKLKDPLFFYVFYPYHLYRSINSPQILAQTKGNSPWIKKLGNGLIQEGLVKDKDYYQIKSFIGEFSFYKSLENIYFNYNDQVNDIKLIGSRLIDMRKHLSQLYPHAGMAVIFPPFMGRLRDHQKFKNFLLKEKIGIVDLPKAQGTTFTYPLDGHLNDLGHLKLSDSLVHFLSKTLKN